MWFSRAAINKTAYFAGIKVKPPTHFEVIVAFLGTEEFA